MSDLSQRDPDQAARLARLVLVAGVAYLLFQTFSPFFTAIAWAAVLSYALHPLHRRLVRATRGQKIFSALLMCSVVTVVIILPLFYLSALIGEELARTYKAAMVLVSQGSLLENIRREYPFVSAVVERLQEYERLTGTSLREALTDNLQGMGQWLFEEATLLVANVLLGLFQTAVMLVCTFYFLLDSERVVRWIENTLPLTLPQQRIVFQRFNEVVRASVEGSTIVAILEGLIGGLAFWVAGLSTPVLWGVVMGVLAYVPAVGASLVWIPGALYLWFIGAYGNMAVVCVAGGIIALLDHVLRTILVGNRSKLHPLLVFCSVLGGIKFFGILGIVAGPLVVAIGRAMLDIYRIEKIGSIDMPSAEKR
ncbi:MAG: AI-2E family transporter [Nitrospiraceae bacterium]|nr:AI-2E family transporter [Nitrospiraceae bacterium]